jgi:hypothetical protein
LCAFGEQSLDPKVIHPNAMVGQDRGRGVVSREAIALEARKDLPSAILLGKRVVEDDAEQSADVRDLFRHGGR